MKKEKYFIPLASEDGWYILKFKTYSWFYVEYIDSISKGYKKIRLNLLTHHKIKIKSKIHSLLKAKIS